MEDRKARLDIFLSPAFVSALLLLLLNDYSLKYAYPNWITGKLSDFTGIFVFVSFFYALLPKQKALISYATALGFIWWKSPLSQPSIDFWNGLNVLPVARAIDYSDLFAVLTLPVAAYHFSRTRKRVPQKLLVYPVALVSLATILGTSVPRTFFAHQFQFDASQPPKVAMIQSGVHEVASRFKLMCHRCGSHDPHRMYKGQQLTMETNFDIETNILYVNVSEFHRSEPSSLSKDLISALSNELKAISNDTAIESYDRRSTTNQRLKHKLRIQKNHGGYPFSIGCSHYSHLQEVFDKFDEYARSTGLTLAYSRDENAPYRSYYTGQVTGPFMTSRTTSVDMTSQCRVGGWTIEVIVAQERSDGTMNTPKLLLELKHLLETTTGQHAQLE